MYRRLLRAYGPQHWWPAESPTEVVIGAILTQNTAWTNVERAIANLRGADLLSFEGLRDISQQRLAELIRPSGTFRVKATRLKAFVDRLWADHEGSLPALLEGDIVRARARLRSIPGIGPETADAILLYAGNRPTFVIDTYTQRVLRRHQLVDASAGYQQVQAVFLANLPCEIPLWNEYHALLVTVGKHHCRALARCEGCPLQSHPHNRGL
jgi:endonuclease-3 related protein